MKLWVPSKRDVSTQSKILSYACSHPGLSASADVVARSEEQLKNILENLGKNLAGTDDSNLEVF